MKINELYQDMKKRNERAKELAAQGFMVTRRSTGASQIHPQYVTDFEGNEKFDTGFGNMVYKTFFKNLYEVNAVK